MPGELIWIGELRARLYGRTDQPASTEKISKKERGSDEDARDGRDMMRERGKARRCDGA